MNEIAEKEKELRNPFLIEELEESFLEATTKSEQKEVLKRITTYQFFALRLSWSEGKESEKAEELRLLRLKLDPENTYMNELKANKVKIVL